MRKNISEEKIISIKESLPQPDDRWLVATQVGFGVLKHDMNQNTNLHVCLVCLHDAFRRVELALDSLFESYANMNWYLNEWKREGLEERERKFWAVRYGKYFADYNLLILYATGEDIADFILHFLEVEASFNTWLQQAATQTKLEKKRISSKAAKVGCFMEENHQTHPITDSILKLRDNNSWKEAMKYRNTWVHDKPPIVDGLGIEYERKSRIEIGDGYKSISFGGGAAPKHSVDEIIDIAHKATEICVESLSDLVEILIAKRIELGEKIDFESGQISSTIP